MNTIDPAKAAQVWQRVQSTAPALIAPDQGLLELIANEWQDAATYLQLSRRFQGKQSALLRTLFQQEQSHTACLKGIYTLVTGKHPKIATVQPPQESTEVLLRKCYGREMRRLAQYEKRVEDPEYGQVFAKLAQQERDHCRIILELLGSL